MAHRYPKDRFDEVPADLERVGAHRAPPRKGRGWIAFGWSAVAVLVLVGIGVIGLFAANGNISIKDPLASGSHAPSSSTTPSAKPTPTPTPTVNPALNVFVLNGTKQPGLAGSTATKLKTFGWKIGDVADASVDDLTQTIVYYSNDANLLAAEALSQELPGSTVAKSQAYVVSGADLTVVLGTVSIK